MSLFFQAQKMNLFNQGDYFEKGRNDQVYKDRGCQQEMVSG